jgi:SAM-dependent methyltransferase
MSRWKPYVERYRGGECRDRIFHDMILEDARRQRRPLTLLDIGCGRGFDGDVPLQHALARAADRYLGVEPDPAVTPADCFSELHRCPFEDAPVAPGSVAVAFAVMVLEHLAEPRRFWDKVWEVLRDGGVFWGLTVDARHWFCRASLWAERLRLKDLYLTGLNGVRGRDRYENYPVFYRSNRPGQVGRYTGRFRARHFVNFARAGQCNSYFPRPLRPLLTLLDRRTVALGKPGALLAIRVVK